jgi:hypothetical protein
MSPKPKKTAKAQKSAGAAVRSDKAGKPPADMVTRPRVKRRQPSAHGAYRKDGVIQESAEGPHRVWGISRPKEKTTERRKGRRRL